MENELTIQSTTQPCKFGLFLVFPKAFCAQKLSITSGVETPKNSAFGKF